MTPYKKAAEWYHCDCTKKKRRIRMPVLKSQFTLRLNLADHAKIKKIAEAENRSMTNMIEMLIILISNQYIDNVYILIRN